MVEGSAVEKLNELTRRRDFRLDRELLEEAFRKEMGRLLIALESRVLALQGKMHPSQALRLDTEKTFAIYVVEEDRTHPLATCFIDSSRPGVLLFSFQRGEENLEEVRVVLESFEKRRDHPSWLIDDFEQRLGIDQVANTFIEKLLNLAAETVKRELCSTY